MGLGGSMVVVVVMKLGWMTCLLLITGRGSLVIVYGEGEYYRKLKDTYSITW